MLSTHIANFTPLHVKRLLRQLHLIVDFTQSNSSSHSSIFQQYFDIMNDQHWMFDVYNETVVSSGGDYAAG